MIASGVFSGASWRSAPILDTAWRAGSRLGKTESATATRNEDMDQEPATKNKGPLPSHRFFHVFHGGKDDRAFRRHENVLLEPAGLLEFRVPREGLDGEVH